MTSSKQNFSSLKFSKNRNVNKTSCKCWLKILYGYYLGHGKKQNLRNFSLNLEISFINNMNGKEVFLESLVGNKCITLLKKYSIYK